MKKQIIIVFVFCSMFLVNFNIVLAHPGRTDSRGCHKCRTNCPNWGLNMGEYHCHGGNTYTNSKGQTFDSNGTLISNGSSPNTNTNARSNTNNYVSAPKAIPKSNDNTLKSVTIDGESIVVLDQMNYETKKEKIEILAETNDSKATYNINNHVLQIGENTIDIKVTAENGDVRNYSLVVDRIKLSNNVGIKIMVDNEKIDFLLGEAETTVLSDTIDLNYNYELEDKKSKVEVTGDKDLKFGENIVIFTVTAEDGTEAKYKLKVIKYTKANEIMTSLLGLATMCGTGYGIYYFIKRRKK